MTNDLISSKQFRGKSKKAAFHPENLSFFFNQAEVKTPIEFLMKPISHEIAPVIWFPPLTWRLQDTVGIFLLFVEGLFGRPLLLINLPSFNGGVTLTSVSAMAGNFLRGPIDLQFNTKKNHSLRDFRMAIV